MKELMLCASCANELRLGYEVRAVPGIREKTDVCRNCRKRRTVWTYSVEKKEAKT